MPKTYYAQGKEKEVKAGGILEKGAMKRFSCVFARFLVTWIRKGFQIQKSK